MARKLPEFITRDEYEKLLKAEKDKTIRACYMLGFESGMRISEIVGWKDRVPALTKENVETHYIKVISGKGKKDRVVPRPKRFNASAVALLPLRVSRRTLQYKITALAKKILGKHVTFHMLRHGFVTHLIDKGLELHEVQMFAGHSRLDTTGVYLHVNPKQAIKKYEEVF